MVNEVLREAVGGMEASELWYVHEAEAGQENNAVGDGEWWWYY